VNGWVTGVRFYKGAGNTGTHVGHLWTADGTLLSTVEFTGESAAGWQQATFATPVAVTANTTYVVSYHAPNGRYAVTPNGFADAGVDAPPLHALRSGVDGPNGVYRYGPGGFPTSASDSNYWVDVVFSDTTPADTTAPAVTSTAPAGGAEAAPVGTRPAATFSEQVQASSVEMSLTGPGGSAVTGSTTYDTAARTATFEPAAPLAHASTYTARVTGARDQAGNDLAAPRTWSFTTAPAPDTTAPSVTATTPGSGATWVSTTARPAATLSEPVQAATVQASMRRSTGVAVAGSTGYDAATRTVTFTPGAALALNATYTVTVSGARDAAGNAMADRSWSFSTGSRNCPCSVWAATARPVTAAVASTRPIEVGLKFRTSVAGTVTGVRFYKGAGNSGTHVGKLWRNGTLLASVTFTGETASGWQQALFSTPVAVTANATYVVSYWAPAGRHAQNSFGLFSSVNAPPLLALRSGLDGVNGVYRLDISGYPTSGTNHNYWVDVVFQPGS
jgi:hypothetical protein